MQSNLRDNNLNRGVELCYFFILLIIFDCDGERLM